MEQLNEVLSSNIVFLRKANNLTQSELAQKLQYSDKTISKWETGEIIPNLENTIKLCEIFGVTLNEITTPMPENKPITKKRNFQNQNKIIITLLAILTVWATATAIFVYAKIIASANLWIIFIWAIPASCIITIIFNAIWGKRLIGFVAISLLIWSLITAIYLQFLTYNLFVMYFIGIPLQVAVLLWSGLKK